jgi:predicted permease
VPVGFDPSGVATVDLSLPAARYAGARAHNAFHEALLRRVEALPGVAAAGVTGALPFSPTAATTMVPQDGVSDLQHGADVITATPGFFTALRVPLVRGRLFTDRDRAGAAPVAIVNESAARTFWPVGIDAVGRAITMKDWGDPYTALVVGIVRDVRQASPDQPAAPAVYYPLAQFPETTLVETIVARGTPSVPLLTASIAGVVRSMDHDQPIGTTTSMDERMSATTAQRRINLVLLGAFATSALAIAAVGIYGVIAFALTSRTREIGVRLALGARRRHIIAFAILHGAMPTIAGIAIGLVAALAGARVLKDLVFAVPVRDPLSAGVAVLAVILAAVAALAGPTRRALRVDPVVALKAE